MILRTYCANFFSHCVNLVRPGQTHSFVRYELCKVVLNHDINFLIAQSWVTDSVL